MEISREDAGRALQDIGQTTDRVFSLRYSRSAAPHFIIWGLVWMTANVWSVYRAESAGRMWAVMVALGALASLFAGYWMARRRSPNDEVARLQRQRDRRFLLSFLAIIAFLFFSSAVMPAWQSPLQFNAWISLFWALIYVLAGIWSASRIAWLGVMVAAIALFGFFVVPGHFALWMGLVGGGSLTGAGLWLLRA